ncbi:site-specific integrase [Methyloceanibacter sp. wino2]|uniref:tyrosine-type recombinase/integrase n=1 Tax=Methyloceanibacter sp. wino2 TaxID=2170729 RepID=UPI00131F10A9|nr:site-specific integrase [Methyloceanibacter sp. wino2]
MAADKRKFSDTFLRSLQSAPTGLRVEFMDTVVPGFGVRLTDKGRKTFILLARYPGSNNPTRRKLGEYPSLSLEKARKKARDWIDLIKDGKDPRNEEEAQRRAEQRKRDDRFEGVVEAYVSRVLPSQRRGDIVAREMRREFCGRWTGRPISSIERRDVIEAISEVVERGATYQAHNLFGHLRSFFNWCIEAGDYGLEHSPCDRIRPNKLIGERKSRQRVLTDAELRAFWIATGEIGYPFGPLYRLLLLTGARKSEIGEARERELDRVKKALVIPPERFKSDATHIVPLTDEAMKVIDGLPVFEKPNFLFSTSFGVRPVSGFANAKERLDRLMAAELGRPLDPWRNHDLRRTMRTQLAALRVSDTIAEMVIGHGRRGLQRVYDQHSYEREMREALELWADRLHEIVTTSA